MNKFLFTITVLSSFSTTTYGVDKTAEVIKVAKMSLTCTVKTGDASATNRKRLLLPASGDFAFIGDLDYEKVMERSLQSNFPMKGANIGANTFIDEGGESDFPFVIALNVGPKGDDFNFSLPETVQPGFSKTVSLEDDTSSITCTLKFERYTRSNSLRVKGSK